MPSATRPRRRRAHAPETPVEAREGEVLVWTDGACRTNPGPGGWAAIVVAAGEVHVELSGHAPQTTNNRMEYTAALEGLRSLPPGSRACIVTDSRLMLDSMTKWIHGWSARAGRPRAATRSRTRTWRALDAEIARHERSAGTGSAATRPAPSTSTRRSTTAPTGSRSPPPRRAMAAHCSSRESREAPEAARHRDEYRLVRASGKIDCAESTGSRNLPCKVRFPADIDCYPTPRRREEPGPLPAPSA